MVFNSQTFIFLFLPITLIIYFFVGNRFKNYILLITSLIFYAWASVNHTFLLLIYILINYILGILISNFKNNNRNTSKIILTIGVIINLFILFYYKYFDFSIKVTNHLFNTSIPLKYIALPLGISFISFQAISYIVDIYRGDAVVNKNPFYVALYMSLFPKVTSGPIIKYKHIDEQIRNRSITIEKFSYGIERFIFGLAKKVIISDILGNMSDDIFSVLNTGIDTPSSWIAIICYTLQIYFDFSGYSDMAIGLANMFGFNFIENFNYPYISKSIREFWRRWHISLSTWFKEYLYIPLGGNRKGSTRTLINLLIVFFATGIWHGASPNFIIWGFWHGLFMVIERLIKDKDWYKKIPNFIKLILTLFIVMLGWVFFRVNSISEAIKFIAIMFGIKQYDYVSFDYRYFLNTKLIVWIIIGAVLSTPLISNIFKKYKNIKGFELVKTILIGILFIISIIFIVNSTYSPFIYFQF
ncbi:alginate O-acetyltransferase [Clostridium isatidis]|uniref:Alginate O-acetyltransferase n=1 Tax=Clostridium isatidis TaxID=182773 RepID=A0A343JA88_9CLOT|nr:alginate O-acetyltransferase [Clostridium isatidis]